MAFVRIKQIISGAGRLLVIGLALFFVEQIPFAGDLYGAGASSKKTAPSRNHPAAGQKKILKIETDITSPTDEVVNIELSGRFPPVAQVIEGETPKIFCDFPDVRMEKSIRRTIDVNGKFILQIRTGIHPPPDPKSRVVLDLAPHHDYEVEQFFYEKENRYSLVIREKAKE